MKLLDDKKSIKNNASSVKVDWDLLFDEWIMKGCPNKYEFMRDHGFEPKSDICQRQMAMWEKGVSHVIDNVVISCKDILKNNNIKAPTTNTWEIIEHFRQTQSRNDFRRANMLAKHVEDILAESWEKIPITDATTGETTGHKLKSTIAPSKLSHLANVLSQIQKIQRLALGMSTDNIGVDNPHSIDTTIEKKDEIKEKRGPIFIVEVSDNGKFLQPRPKRIE